ncbi:MAG: hypothetical protein IPH31_11785 [Lewinellaceae bacterium]|nr:hypothetical protein [Lewinellaceae bacterium]
MAQPWKTLAKSKSTLLSGDSVFLSNGNYGAYIENLNTGNRTDWVTYLAAPGQTAVIFNYIDVDGLEVMPICALRALIYSIHNNPLVLRQAPQLKSPPFLA